MAHARNNNGGAKAVTPVEFNERLKRIFGTKADAERESGRPPTPPRRKWSGAKS